MSEHTHEDIAELARHAWTDVVYPTCGEQSAMLFGIVDEDQVIVSTVPGCHPADWADRLAKPGAPTDVLDWVAWVGTGYVTQVASLEEALAIAGSQAEHPLENTKHVLIAEVVSKDGHSSATSWMLELPECEIGEMVTNSIDTEGAVISALRRLMAAMS